MILLARALVRLVSFLLLVILAVAGIVVAVFCISTGTSGPSLGKLASILHLASVRDTVGHWLGQLESSGSVAVLAGPGLFHMIPIVDVAARYVDQRVRVANVSAESTLTRDSKRCRAAAWENRTWLVRLPKKSLPSTSSIGLGSMTRLAESTFWRSELCGRRCKRQRATETSAR